MKCLKVIRDLCKNIEMLVRYAFVYKIAC